jgi:serine protease AprX
MVLLGARRAARLTGLLALAALAGAPAAVAAPRSRDTTVIVRFAPGTAPTAQRRAVRSAGGRVVRNLQLIRALAARVPRAGARALARRPGIIAVTPDARVRSAGRTVAKWDPKQLGTTFDLSTRATFAWSNPLAPATGRGVAVAVLDTGIDGGLPDFKGEDGRSRVVASAVTNPDATTAEDLYGHGTHVAGLVAGNGLTLPASDPLYGRYVGAAPGANLVSVKVSDDHGNATLIDVIAGLQFAVDHRADYNIRVVNLSLDSTVATSYLTDPLDAAAEAAWRHGIVVIASAGNLGTAADAVSYAPANDPYVITVGAADEHGTPATGDDTVAAWSSRGVTQDGFTKPDLVAPGAHIIAPLAPGSDFAAACSACVVDGRYFQLSGTSMAAPIVAGIAADVLSARPGLTPDQVKGALKLTRPTADGSGEVAADLALLAPARLLQANVGLVPSTLLTTKGGDIDPARASWKRASWSAASGGLQAGWARASWKCECDAMTAGTGLTRASWGMASWSSLFG